MTGTDLAVFIKLSYSTLHIKSIIKLKINLIIMTSYLLSVIFSYIFLSPHGDIKEDDDRTQGCSNYSSFKTISH